VNQIETETITAEEVVLKETELKILTLYNDDIHTFEYVIEALVEICKHTTEQAEQCAYIVHYNEQCDIKVGTYTALQPMEAALVFRNLNVAIN